MILLLLLGATLIILNILGCFLPYPYGKVISSAKHPNFERSQIIENFSSLNHQENEEPEAYIKRLMTTVNGHMIHYQPQMREITPLRENWILYLLSFIPFPYLGYYEFMNYKRALKKGYGLCSQISFTITAVLKKNNFEAYVIRFPGHVIASAMVEDHHYLIDGDYNILLPYSIEELQNHLDIIDKYYGNVGFKNTEELKSIYKKPYTFVPHGKIFIKTIFEETAYILKWIIPLILMLIGFKGLQP